MATIAATFIPAAANPTKIIALGETTASSVQTFSKYALLAIEATGVVNVTFCLANDAPTISSNVGWQIQAGAVAEFDLGGYWDSVIIYNPSGSATVDVYILPLSKM